MKKALFYFIFSTFPFSLCIAQDTITIEKDLLNLYSRVSYWVQKSDLPNGLIDEDSLGKANDIFQNKLLYYTSVQPQTMKARFTQLLKNPITILNSDDGKLRIYNWDDMQGGMMRYFRNVFQFKSGDKVFSCLLPHRDSSSELPADRLFSFEKIYTFPVSASVYYLIVYDQIISNHYIGTGIKIFSIQNASLNDTVHLIKTKTGMHNEIVIDYDPQKLDPGVENHIIYFDKSSQTIFIPIVDENSAVTGKYMRYHFTGKYFEKIADTK